MQRRLEHETLHKTRDVIKLSIFEGTVTLGWDDDVHSLLGDDSDANRPTKARAKKLFIGRSISIGTYAFWGFSGITEATVSENTNVNSAAFAVCRNLAHLNSPRSLTAIPALLFSHSGLRIFVPGDAVQSISSNVTIYCHALRRAPALPNIPVLSYGTYYECYAITRVDIGEKTNTINGSALFSAHSIVELTIPPIVSSIASGAFNGMRGLCKLRFFPTIPPAVANANAFNGIPTTCVVEVPVDSLSTYQEATNYAPIAAQMVGV